MPLAFVITRVITDQRAVTFSLFDFVKDFEDMKTCGLGTRE